MATYTPRKGRITATVRVKGHPSQSETFDTKRDAKAWATELELKLRSEIAGQFSHITLRLALERYRDDKVPALKGALRDSNRINHMLVQNKLPIDLPLEEVTKKHLEDWSEYRLKTLKPSSVKRDLSLLNAFLNVCVSEWKYIKVNPLAEVAKIGETQHRERVISYEEEAALLQQLQHDDATKPVSIGRQVAVMFQLAIETGMRASEICRLTWDRVRLEKKFVYLHTSKNGRPREVPLSPRAIFLLQMMEGLNEREVFMPAPSTLDGYFRKARGEAGLSGFTFHDTRHTAATRIVATTKIDVLSLCKMFGWRDPKKALVYFNPTTTAIADLL